jgi:rsbT co-antagonist protein RsbR
MRGVIRISKISYHPDTDNSFDNAVHNEVNEQRAKSYATRFFADLRYSRAAPACLSAFPYLRGASIMTQKTRIPEYLKKYENELLTEWMRAQMATTAFRSDLTNESDLREESRRFLNSLAAACQSGNLEKIDRPEWNPLREQLNQLSRSRAIQGFTPTDTAIFVFSFKQPLFDLLRSELSVDVSALADEIWNATQLLDKLGLYTVEAFQKSREEVIKRQQEEMLELSTPVVKLWDGVLALPMIGTLDSSRTQVVMESLLQRIVETGSEIAIIDITGVPTVDTLVAQHLLKTVTAARLMGAECIISGIRPQIAATIVHLGVDLGDVTTKSTLADAFSLALQRTGRTIGRAIGGYAPQQAPQLSGSPSKSLVQPPQARPVAPSVWN